MIISKLYNKNHLFFILFIFIGFIYSLYNYFIIKKSLMNIFLLKKLLLDRVAELTPNLLRVYIKNGNKVYNVELDYGNCIKYLPNSKIYVIYDKQNDSYIYPVEEYNTGRIYFLGIILLISIIPWTYLLEFTNSNKGKSNLKYLDVVDLQS